MFSPQKICIIVGLVCSFLIIQETKAKILYKEEEEENDLMKQYKLLQKPSIKMIQNKYGDIYDCVDFYKQPAFDHPLLKNHTFYPEMQSNYLFEDVRCDPKSIKFEDGGCPFGTVPIRRVSKDEFYEIYNFTKAYAKSNIQQPIPGTYVILRPFPSKVDGEVMTPKIMLNINKIVVAQTNTDPSKVKYCGVGAGFNNYNLQLEESQYSSGEFVIQNGDDRIKVGWTVNPKLNKDNRIRGFQYLDAGKSHCFNMLCPGFVLTQSEVTIDNIFASPSIRGQDALIFGSHVYQDVGSGHWWLNICGKTVGFWPEQIFTKLSNSASYIAVGGEAYGPTNRPLPPMGNGYYPVNNIKLTAFFTALTLVDANHNKIARPQLEQYTNDPHYGINYVQDAGVFGHIVFYGGINK